MPGSEELKQMGHIAEHFRAHEAADAADRAQIDKHNGQSADLYPPLYSDGEIHFLPDGGCYVGNVEEIRGKYLLSPRFPKKGDKINVYEGQLVYFTPSVTSPILPRERIPGMIVRVHNDTGKVNLRLFLDCMNDYKNFYSHGHHLEWPCDVTYDPEGEDGHSWRFPIP